MNTKHYNLHAFHLGFQKKNQIIRNISNFFKGTENWQLDETLCNDLIKMRQKKMHISLSILYSGKAKFSLETKLLKKDLMFNLFFQLWSNGKANLT